MLGDRQCLIVAKMYDSALVARLAGFLKGEILLKYAGEAMSFEQRRRLHEWRVVVWQLRQVIYDRRVEAWLRRWQEMRAVSTLQNLQ